MSTSTDDETNHYLFNTHGDVTGIANDAQNVTKSYEYDAFGNEKEPSITDDNPFRYCGEYYDTETGTYYLRARYYDPAIGRFTQQDTHWNTANMIYGDNPNKINEREDALGLKTYTYVPSINSIMQSGNLYVYGINNPILFSDYNGNSVSLATVIATVSAAWVVVKPILIYTSVQFIKGVGWQFVSDVVEYKINNESGPEELFSSPTEYFASGVSNIVPGGHLWSGVSSATINEAVLIGNGILKNKQIDWSEHWNNLLRNTITNTTIDSVGTIFNKLKAKLSTKSSPSNNSVDSSTSPHKSSFSTINNVDISEPLFRDILSRSGYVIRTVSIY